MWHFREGGWIKNVESWLDEPEEMQLCVAEMHSRAADTLHAMSSTSDGCAVPPTFEGRDRALRDPFLLQHARIAPEVQQDDAPRRFSCVWMGADGGRNLRTCSRLHLPPEQIAACSADVPPVNQEAVSVTRGK